METSVNKKYKKILLLVVVLLFFFYGLVGIIARRALLDSGESFPTWTHSHQLKFINAFTSWDSGFYFAIAREGYPKQGPVLTKTDIEVPAESWVKVFLGAGVVGHKKVPLPYTTASTKVNNTVFFINATQEVKYAPIYNAYVGIPHCAYTGDILFERDVLPLKESLTNPTACGGVPCNESYVTYYDIANENVVYQEVFKDPNSDSSTVLIGAARPIGIVNRDYYGFECKTVQDFDLEEENQLNYKREYTAYSFFPLYSWLSGVGAQFFTDVVLAGIFFSAVFTFLATTLIIKIIQTYKPDANPIVTGMVFLLFPTTFYGFMFLPVSLLTLLFFSVFYFSKQGNLVATLVSAVLLALTHWLGIVLLVPILILTFQKSKAFNSLLAFAAALFAFFLHLNSLYKLTGDWLLIFKSRIPWYGGATSPFGSLISYVFSFELIRLVEILGFFALIAVLLVLKKQSSDNKQVAKLADTFLYTFVALPVFIGSLTGILSFVPVVIPLYLFVLEKMSSEDKQRKYFIVGSLFVLNIVFFILWTISSRFVV